MRIGDGGPRELARALEACAYCDEYYPRPVSLHHTTVECERAQAKREGKPPAVL